MGSRVAVLVSGGGTNLQALLDDPAVAPHVCLVISDRAGVRALERAEVRAVEALVIDPATFEDRVAFDAAVLAALQERGIDVLVSAGWMRLLGRTVLDEYEGRWL